MNGHDSIILAAGSNVVTSALDLFSQFAIIGGGLWAVWAVYAARDLHKDGTAVITATDAYRALVSADVEHENDWTAYIQCKRIKTAGRVENRFTEHFNDKGLESNVVWTRTPDMTPGLHLEKYDVKSGERLGDRDDVKQALKMDGDSLEIAFKITNTSKVDSSTGEGAWFRARDLKLTDDPTGERSARPFPYHRPSLFGFVGNVQTGAFSTAIPWSCHPKQVERKPSCTEPPSRQTAAASSPARCSFSASSPSSAVACGPCGA
ncbi:LPXTG cell wall anchor domain-containing protein [Bifidobacterium breve]|jgi:hypothetical protein|uniref:LPXTG cell wall anchor domain-containing protein n=1 Tax=Bifidobacterium breve TaxID=1685 RepID=UPI0029C35C01|nr:LPXTG cell wall anchor domain-containing protein [Bifidobacterium breve]MDX5142622.1 LPXTG cell wall anchor domain-containing protein [Bifidobacterium breve]